MPVTVTRTVTVWAVLAPCRGDTMRRCRGGAGALVVLEVVVAATGDALAAEVELDELAPLPPQPAMARTAATALTAPALRVTAFMNVLVSSSCMSPVRIRSDTDKRPRRRGFLPPDADPGGWRSYSEAGTQSPRGLAIAAWAAAMRAIGTRNGEQET